MNSQEAPDSKTWDEWLQHPCTKALRAWAEAQREDLKEQWASGAFSDQFDMAMAVKNAGATGACSVYVDVEELDYSLIIEGETDGKQDRAKTTRQERTG